MNRYTKGLLCFVFAFFAVAAASAQESLLSAEEEYYRFLSIQGAANRPTLNYRTLSDSVWTVSEQDSETHVWAENNLGTWHDLFGNVRMRIYGPDWYNSFNTAVPYGQNDGALWQGKGYNTSLTAGFRFEGYGLELTLKPQLAFSQNLAFDFLPSAYDSQYGYFWGYGNNMGIDAPQRFGDKAFWTFDWGDTEIRYTWKTLTVGFGTQSVWLGSAQINPILHSNNAPTYPKFDIGLRRQRVKIPWLNWYIGDVEARMWVGYLTESAYFDNDEGNNHNMISGFSFAYAPSFLPGLTLGLNKICLSKWGDNSWKYINPFYDTNEAEDQKASVTVDWVIPAVGLEIYGEIGIDDYLQGGMVDGVMRYPFDTLVWNAGLKKSIAISKQKQLYGELSFECTSMELPRNKPRTKYSFNMHHQITQGFTQKGQCIGSNFGVGGNSQLLRFKLYYPKGFSTLFIERNNPDNTYSYVEVGNCNNTYKANFNVGLESAYYIMPSFRISCGAVYNFIINSLYFSKDENGNPIGEGTGTGKGTEDIYNFSFVFSLKYTF